MLVVTCLHIISALEVSMCTMCVNVVTFDWEKRTWILSHSFRVVDIWTHNSDINEVLSCQSGTNLRPSLVMLLDFKISLQSQP